MTRSVPNSCTRPTSVLNGWPASATSSPIRNTRGSRRISSAIASFTASPYVSSRSPMRCLPCPVPKSLDDLVRPPEHGRRNRQADLLRGLQVDGELELRGLFHRQVGRP